MNWESHMAFELIKNKKQIQGVCSEMDCNVSYALYTFRTVYFNNILS